MSAEPEFYSFREDTSPEAIREAAERQHQDGATFFRATLADGGVWIEGWRERPEEEPPFNPPRVPAP